MLLPHCRGGSNEANPISPVPSVSNSTSATIRLSWKIATRSLKHILAVQFTLWGDGVIGAYFTILIETKFVLDEYHYREMTPPLTPILFHTTTSSLHAPPLFSSSPPPTLTSPPSPSSLLFSPFNFLPLHSSPG